MKKETGVVSHINHVTMSVQAQGVIMIWNRSQNNFPRELCKSAITASTNKLEMAF